MLSANEANVTPISLEDLRRLDPFTPDLSQELLEEGVVVVPTMPESQCKVVGAAICDAESFIGLEKTGYVTTYYLPEKEVLVTGNPAVYRALRAAYRVFDEFHGDVETDFLTISKPERVSIKRTGAKELKKHVDLNFHRSPVWVQPGIRVQAMQVLQIGPWSPEQPNGTLQVVRRFHRYPRLAAAALHPYHGVVGMRQDRFTAKDSLHMFMPFSPPVPLAAFSLYVRVVEALSANTPTPLAEEGAASAADLPYEGYIEGVEVAAIWDHARGLVTRGGPFSWSSLALGPKDLCWEPVEDVASGSLVLWDGGLPHANYPNLSKVTRIVAYLDMSPLHRPNGMPRAERIEAMQLTSSGGRSQGEGRDAEKGRSRRGDGHHDNEQERDYATSGAWARHAEQRAAGSSHLWTCGGVYAHPCTDNLLLRALYGVDPRTGQEFAWESYGEAYARVASSAKVPLCDASQARGPGDSIQEVQQVAQASCPRSAVQEVPLAGAPSPLPLAPSQAHSPAPIFTIGHSNHTAQAFLALLRRHNIGDLVDVRSIPSSGRFPHFKKRALQELCASAHITYRWCAELGNKLDGIATLLRRPEGQAALLQLAEAARSTGAAATGPDTHSAGATAFMCAEAEWRDCHRQVIAQQLLEVHRVVAVHILRDGTQEPHPRSHLLPAKYGMPVQAAVVDSCTPCGAAGGDGGESVEAASAAADSKATTSVRSSRRWGRKA